MIKDRNTAIFYTTATCNLHCRYCVIDKNPVLKRIDDMLDESFKGDYYFEYTKELFPNKEQLTNVEIWGGEPYLAMHRIYHTLEKMLEYYPNLNEVFGSTNLISTNFIEEFKGLMNVLGKANRPMKMRLQLSLDGTEEICDMNRGKGVTKKFAERMIELSKLLPKILPNNVKLEMAFKPTLDIYSLHLLNTKEKIIKYFKFFEQFYDLYKQLDSEKIYLRPSKPNFAMPSEFTQEDGLYFRDFCKMTRELEEEHIFKYYDDITLFSKESNEDIQSNCLSGSTGLCGTGRIHVGMLPNKMVSMCHMAFVDLISDYKDAMLKGSRETSVSENMFSVDYASNFCFPVEKLDEYETMINNFYQKDSKAKISTLTNEIIMLAYAGQIQDKYKNYDKAIKGAQFICSHCAFCVKDNIAVTGSYYGTETGTIKVFLNGAEDLIAKEDL